jgi:glycosyltransferase involved in cell wall biosynthesis
MKIAHFLLGRCNPESANGIDRTVYYVSEKQAALGHEVSIFSITHLPPIAVPRVEVNVYSPRRLPLELRAERLKHVLDRSPTNLPKELVADLLGRSPDIVHFHFIHMPQALRIASRLGRIGVPYCVSLHGGLAVEAQRRHRFAKQMFAALFERRYLTRAAFLHAVSRLDADGARAYGVRNRIVIAPNGIDLGNMPAKADRALLRRRFPEVDERRVFMYLGRLDPEQKGLDLLLRAWDQARTRSASVLVLVGPDWRDGRGRLEQIAADLELQDSVLFAGRLSGTEKWSLLAAADIFIHPSRWEAGVPFAVLEAMVASRPLLVTGAADPDRLTARYRAGWIAEPDLTGLTAALERAGGLQHRDLVSMGINSRRLVEREFRWERTTEKLMDAYQRAVDESGRRGSRYRADRWGGSAI